VPLHLTNVSFEKPSGKFNSMGVDSELDDAGSIPVRYILFLRDWSWNTFYDHLHCTSALACTAVISFLWKCRERYTGTKLKSLTMNDSVAELRSVYTGISMWLTFMMRRVNFKHHQHLKQICDTSCGIQTGKTCS
jgi:hypothetical protein